MGKVDEITHMVDNQPGQMLRVVEVLTLETLKKKQKNKLNILKNTNVCTINTFLMISVHYLFQKYFHTLQHTIFQGSHHIVTEKDEGTPAYNLSVDHG